MRQRRVVLAGTDTGVGKTVVGAGLARALARRGRHVVAIKPLESGCAPGGARPDEDGVALARATGQEAPREALVRLPDPLTPALAADRAGVAVALDDLIARVADLSAAADVVLVEGAGGLLSPLGWDFDAIDLARGLGATTLLVGMDRLGALHQLLSGLRCLDAAGLPVCGVVLSTPASVDASTGTNAASLARRIAETGAPVPPIAVVPRVASEEEAGALLGEVAAWVDAPG